MAQIQHLEGMQLDIWLIVVSEEGSLRVGVREGKQEGRFSSSLILTIVLAAFFGGRLIQGLSVIGGC